MTEVARWAKNMTKLPNIFSSYMNDHIPKSFIK